MHQEKQQTKNQGMRPRVGRGVRFGVRQLLRALLECLFGAGFPPDSPYLELNSSVLWEAILWIVGCSTPLNCDIQKCLQTLPDVLWAVQNYSRLSTTALKGSVLRSRKVL